MGANFAYYQSALAGENPPIHDGDAQPGLYRKRRNKGGPFVLVKIAPDDDGNMVFHAGDDVGDANDVWTFCADKPVSKADAVVWEQTGRWPGDAPEIGDNNPPPEEGEDDYARLKRLIEGHAKAAHDWVSPDLEGKIAGDKAANWKSDVLALEKEIKNCHTTEKKPHKEAADAVDAKWKGLKSTAESLKRSLAKVIDSIGTKERARLQTIADKKAKEDADRKRREWEEEQEQRRLMAGQLKEEIEEEVAPVFEAKAEPVKVNFGGATGAKVSARKAAPKAFILDWKKAAAHYSSNQKVRDLIQRLANADIKAGKVVDGIRSTEDRVEAA